MANHLWSKDFEIMIGWFSGHLVIEHIFVLVKLQENIAFGRSVTHGGQWHPVLVGFAAVPVAAGCAHIKMVVFGFLKPSVFFAHKTCSW